MDKPLFPEPSNAPPQNPAFEATIDSSQHLHNRLQRLEAHQQLAAQTTGIGFWSIHGHHLQFELDAITRKMLGLPEGRETLSIEDTLQHVKRSEQWPLWSQYMQLLPSGQLLPEILMQTDLHVHIPGESPRILQMKARVFGTEAPQSLLGVVWAKDTPIQRPELPFMHRDPLTGLPNRAYFMERLGQHLQMHMLSRLSCAVLLLDLDRFKEINEQHGSPLGDEVLVSVARRLQSCLPPQDLLARIGGDSFAVLLTGVQDQSTPSRTAERLLDCLSQVHALPSGLEVHVQGTIGIALFPQDSERPNQLLGFAEDALSYAKQQARSGYFHYQQHARQEVLDRRTLTRGLMEAVQHHHLELHYQPIITPNQPQIRKAEALLRWKHPEKGYISPAVFIPLAEETGMIHLLGEWVQDTVIQQIQDWDQEGLPPITVSINISARQFLQPGSMQHFLQQLENHGIPPERIIIEITESVFLQDQQQVEQQFKLLQQAGIRIALDDFGTGYSSLGYLTRFNPHYIKIDRSFVNQIGSGQSDPIIEAILSMGHHLNKTLIAEGVETPEQAQWLTERGCHHLQGYLFSRPINAQNFSALVRNFSKE